MHYIYTYTHKLYQLCLSPFIADQLSAAHEVRRTWALQSMWVENLQICVACHCRVGSMHALKQPVVVHNRAAQCSEVLVCKLWQEERAHSAQADWLASEIHYGWMQTHCTNDA